MRSQDRRVRDAMAWDEDGEGGKRRRKSGGRRRREGERSAVRAVRMREEEGKRDLSMSIV